MSFKKLAAEYELTKITSDLVKALSKLGSSGAPTQKKTLAVSTVAQSYIESNLKAFNDKIDREIPISGPDGEPSEVNARARMIAGKVQNVQWKSVATVLDQGAELGQKILKIDFYITVQAANAEPFISFFKNGERGLTNIPPSENVQVATAADYRVPQEEVRVYVNGIITAGELTDEEVNQGLEDAILGTASTSTKKTVVKNSHREYLEGLAKKVANSPEDNISYLENTGEDTNKQLEGKFFEMGRSNTPYEIIRKAQEKLKSINLYYGSLDGKLGPLTEAALKKFQKRMGNLDITGKLDQRTYNILMQMNDAVDSEKNRKYSLELAMKAKENYLEGNFDFAKTALEQALSLNPGGEISNSIKGLLDIVNRKV
jgi:hypothetical protein